LDVSSIEGGRNREKGKVSVRRQLASFVVNFQVDAEAKKVETTFVWRRFHGKILLLVREVWLFERVCLGVTFLSSYFKIWLTVDTTISVV
jgi:hypothetical protein